MSRRRPTKVAWIVLAVVVVVAVAVTVAVLDARHSERKAPPFVAGPGKFRVMAQSGDGAQRQHLTSGSTTVVVSLGPAFREGGVAKAGMSFGAPSEPGGPSRGYAVYRVGDTVTLGSVHIRVLAIYVEPDQHNDAVDVQLSKG